MFAEQATDQPVQVSVDDVAALPAAERPVDLPASVGVLEQRTGGAGRARCPANLLSVSPSTEGVTMLPLVLIPTTVVPLAVALHLLSLRQLRAPRRATAPTSQPAFAGR